MGSFRDAHHAHARSQGFGVRDPHALAALERARAEQVADVPRRARFVVSALQPVGLVVDGPGVDAGLLDELGDRALSPLLLARARGGWYVLSTEGAYLLLAALGAGGIVDGVPMSSYRVAPTPGPGRPSGGRGSRMISIIRP